MLFIEISLTFYIFYVLMIFERNLSKIKYKLSLQIWKLNGIFRQSDFGPQIFFRCFAAWSEGGNRFVKNEINKIAYEQEISTILFICFNYIDKKYFFNIMIKP